MPDFQPTIPLEKLPPGKSTTVEVEGKTVALFNVDGTVHAISDTCMHAGHSLGWGILEGNVVRCRGHGWRFDVRTGRVLSGPTDVPLATYPVRLEEDRLLVQLPGEG